MLADRSGYNRDKVAQSKQAPKLKPISTKFQAFFFVTLFFVTLLLLFLLLIFGRKLDNRSKYLAATIKHAHKVLMSNL
jgi:hypothetical protein